MKVGQLLKFLEGVNPHLEVILSIDEEGNAFKALADVDVDAAYRSDGNYFDVKHPDDVEGDEPRGVVLWP